MFADGMSSIIYLIANYNYISHSPSDMQESSLVSWRFCTVASCINVVDNSEYSYSTLDSSVNAEYVWRVVMP